MSTQTAVFSIPIPFYSILIVCFDATKDKGGKVFKFLSAWGALLYIPPNFDFSQPDSEIFAFPILHFGVIRHIICPL